MERCVELPDVIYNFMAGGCEDCISSQRLRDPCIILHFAFDAWSRCVLSGWTVTRAPKSDLSEFIELYVSESSPSRPNGVLPQDPQDDLAFMPSEVHQAIRGDRASTTCLRVFERKINLSRLPIRNCDGIGYI